jgi:hypothetical protein
MRRMQAPIRGGVELPINHLVTESENIRRQKRPPARRQQPGPWNTHPTPRLLVSASAADLGRSLDGERGQRLSGNWADSDPNATALNHLRLIRSRDHGACHRGDDREHMLIAASVDADHVVHFVCKHPD